MVGSASKLIQSHEVFKVRNLAIDPVLSQIRLLEDVLMV